MNPEMDRSRDRTGDDEPIGPKLVPAVSLVAATAIQHRRASLRLRTAAFGALLLVAALVATTIWQSASSPTSTTRSQTRPPFGSRRWMRRPASSGPSQT
jgi:hypothetical protein